MIKKKFSPTHYEVQYSKVNFMAPRPLINQAKVACLVNGLTMGEAIRMFFQFLVDDQDEAFNMVQKYKDRNYNGRDNLKKQRRLEEQISLREEGQALMALYGLLEERKLNIFDMEPMDIGSV